MANTKGEKELKTSWPIDKGLTARTQKQTGRTTNLIPQGLLGVKSIVLQRNRCGIQ
jgi:hypothetical protein